MMKSLRKEKGFTLIEIIVSILLIGFVAVIMSLSGVHMVKSFIYARTNADTLLKSQIAMARIQKELNNVKRVASSSANSVAFTSYRDGANVTIAFNGTNLLLDGFILTDKVSNFSLAYYDNYNSAAQSAFTANTKIIDVNLVITGYEDTPTAYNARIAPSFDMSLNAANGT
ncbi:MAG: hypothetical protein A4E71_03152 [Smithella sp. PtaU1.Bin162]|nr:MAG: hypothetical protein A4E71_03152 [Smithella sp. PtaU1.Bin162]